MRRALLLTGNDRSLFRLLANQGSAVWSAGRFFNNATGVLRNEAAASPRWLGLRLVGRGNRDVVGSTVVLEGSTRRLTRFVRGGGSYLSASDPRLLIGLGPSETVRKITVKWSWGKTQTWDAPELNSYWELREGQPTISRIGLPRTSG